jgi:antiviral helicase SKI2
MLPDHVNIILLSATVPNTKEFADWVGSVAAGLCITSSVVDISWVQANQEERYLCHFHPEATCPPRALSLRWQGALQDCRRQGRVSRYRVRSHIHSYRTARKTEQDHRYKDAGEALRRKQDKEREAAGLAPVSRGGGRGGNGQRGSQPQRRGQQPSRGAPVVRGRGGFRNVAQQDKNLWIHLVGLLRKRDLLPVVIFTFSKKRCEENASSMPNTDLCTAAEKSEIHILIEKSLTRLKGPSEAFVNRVL